MAKCTDQERALLDQLRNASVIAASSYESNRGELRVYRMRLFTETERASLRHAMYDAGKQQGQPSYLCANGCAGMLDELEMVRFEVHGRSFAQIERSI